MNERDALWYACLREPAENARREAFADMLREAGFEALARAVQGRPGWALVNAAAPPELLNLTLQLCVSEPADRDDVLQQVISQELDLMFVSGAEPLGRLATESGAYGWSVDEVEAEIEAPDDGEYRARFSFSASGQPEEGRIGIGTTIRGHGVAVVTLAWGLRIEVTNAEIV